MTARADDIHDLIIIGGGPAGMSAGLMAGRTRLRTLLVNEEAPRNAVTTASHGFLTRDGIHPLEMLEISKQQLEPYENVVYRKGRVTDAIAFDEGFSLKIDGEDKVHAKNIIFATGTKEDISKCGIPGLEECYGKSVYPCPFCDGWEHRNQRLALFDETEFSIDFAKIIGNWSKDLIIFSNGKQSLSASEKALLEQGGIRVEEGAILRLESDSHGRLQAIVLKDGRSIPRDAGFLTNTFAEAATDLPGKLGVKTIENDWGAEVLYSDDFGATNIDGIYVVGDAKTGFGGLIGAAFQGATCVEMLLHKKVSSEWEQF